MKVNKLSNNIFYIENVFDKSQYFIEQIEKFDIDSRVYSVIPPWKEWYNSVPIQDDSGLWKQDNHDYTTGKVKSFDWDISATENKIWPRPELKFEDEAHKLVEPLINLVHEAHLKVLDVWYKETGSKKLEYISKNYCLKKYREGGAIPPHIDKNIDNPLNTLDWTLLFYLNDNYDYGEIKFTDLDITLKPSAGSAILFPCTEMHEAMTVRCGEKYYIFTTIHSEFNYSSALDEPYHNLNKAILKHKGITDHPILSVESNR